MSITFQSYLQLFLDNKLFCEAAEVYLTVVEQLLLQSKIHQLTGLHQIFQVKLVELLIRVSFPEWIVNSNSSIIFPHSINI